MDLLDFLLVLLNIWLLAELPLPIVLLLLANSATVHYLLYMSSNSRPLTPDERREMFGE
jgi:hypothetical protein